MGKKHKYNIYDNITIKFLLCITARGYRIKTPRPIFEAVETTGLHGAGRAVERMDAISQAPLLTVKIYLDEIDKLGNYESILP